MKFFTFCLAVAMFSCTNKVSETAATNDQSKSVRLITLDPGHFHAALVQKSMYAGVDSVVHVYGPESDDLELHLTRIDSYNSRPDAPTSWKEVIYKDSDFLEVMAKEKKGNVVVLAGNNGKKSEYISHSISNGFHVLADKPMAINVKDFEALKLSFETAQKNNLLLYDIMTERYEITTILQRELSLNREVFGTLVPGTAENPAVTKESVHYFFKQVSGSPLIRPPWFFDVEQQGEGIVDVTTHLVDLVQWECFPEQMLDYNRDVEILKARRWSTDLSEADFKAVTRQDSFPDYLQKDVKDNILKVYSNGEISYKVKGIHARVSVLWGYQAPSGAGDSHHSIMRGTLSNLIIRQGEEQNFKPTLYIQVIDSKGLPKETLARATEALAVKYPGVELKPGGDEWEVVIPDKYKEGHEAHFARVTEKFLSFLKQGKLPEWEVPNMLTKYYTTTKALELANQNQ